MVTQGCPKCGTRFPTGSGWANTAITTLMELQPCGGKHLANTAEVGHVIVTKVEKKSAIPRRVVLGFAAAAVAA